MTTHTDHRVWQDVCRRRTPFDGVCLKLSVLDEVVVVVSFEAVRAEGQLT